MKSFLSLSVATLLIASTGNAYALECPADIGPEHANYKECLMQEIRAQVMEELKKEAQNETINENGAYVDENGRESYISSKSFKEEMQRVRNTTEDAMEMVDEGMAMHEEGLKVGLHAHEKAMESVDEMEKEIDSIEVSE